MRKGSLKPEEVIDIRQYLAAHRWLGAKKAMAKKYGVREATISDIFTGRTYKSLLPQRSKNKRICATCIKPILKGHKWEINKHSQCVHRTCDYPEYRSVEEAPQPRTLAATPLFDALESIGA